MQARIANELKDPVMKGLAYGVGAYMGVSFIYTLVPAKATPAPAKKVEKVEHHHEEHHATPVAATTAASHPVEHHHESGGKQQVAPVLQQLNTISDRLTKIEKALGI